MSALNVLASLSPSEWTVLLLAVALIALVNWYFFLAKKSESKAEGKSADSQEATVQGGYDPQVIRVKAGVPLKLTFDRRETSGCSEEVVFPDFNIRRFLPAHQKTTLDLKPDRPGTYEFTCGMNMLRGRIVAE
jgi:plastocyanin domain-containing protein